MAIHKRMLGFTLIELIIVLAMLAIVATVAIPGFSSFIKHSRTEAKANELLSLIHYARYEAASKRTPATIEVNSKSIWTVTSKKQILRQLDPEQTQIKTSSTKVTYRADGTASAASIIICASDDDPKEGYLLQVSQSGSTILYPRGKQDNNGTALANCTPGS